MRPDVSAGVRVLTLLSGDQSPKLFLIFFKRVSGGRCIEHNLVVPPEYLHQPPNKGCQPVLALGGRNRRLNDYLSYQVNRNMTQVACGLFVHSAFNFDRVGLSPFKPSWELQRWEH